MCYTSVFTMQSHVQIPYEPVQVQHVNILYSSSIPDYNVYRKQRNHIPYMQVRVKIPIPELSRCNSARGQYTTLGPYASTSLFSQLLCECISLYYSPVSLEIVKISWRFTDSNLRMMSNCQNHVLSCNWFCLSLSGQSISESMETFRTARI